MSLSIAVAAIGGSLALFGLAGGLVLRRRARRPSGARRLELTAQQLVRIHDQYRLLRLSARVAARYVHARYTAVYLYSRTGAVYQRLASHGQPGGPIVEQIDPASPLVRWLMKYQMPLRAEECQRFDPRGRATTGEDSYRRLRFVVENLQAQAVIPSFVGRRLLGFLVIGDRAGRTAYAREELSALVRLAYGCAVALENAQSYQELKSVAQQLHSVQQRLVQQERMVAAGRLAMGLAHEIKNPLAAMKTFAEFLPERYDDPAFRQQFAAVIAAEVDRISQIVQGLSEFAKPLLRKLEPIEVQQVLRDTAALLTTHCLKQRVMLQQHYEPAPMLVQANANQLKQACLNLCMNALEAMPTGGTLTVSCRYREGKGEGEGDAIIRIEDTGAGMSEEQQARLFEPFSSTKPNGMGLGLTVVKQIVEQHFGALRVESRVGVGSAFEMTLPWATKYSASPTRRTVDVAPGFDREGQAVPIDLLVIDDEPKVREQLQGAFEATGCQVRTAGTAEEALACVASHPPQLVLLDLKLEDGDDHRYEVLKRLKAGWPLLPVMAVTGTCADETMHQTVRELGAVDCYHKPIDLRTLQRRVFELAAQFTRKP